MTSRAFVKKVIPLLDEYPEYSFYISDFIRNGRIHQLTEAASEAIPYTKENKEEFLAQIEKWNDMEKFSKCIKALEDIPEAEQDYDMVMLQVRAYENYAILGDNGEEPEDDEKERALNKALELLESIREAGESRRMEQAHGIRISISCRTGRKGDRICQTLGGT
ncbi:hypothetical protein NIB75_18340 [Bacteroides uniformis]|nr:hypothetical protein [Bacteroides uniformis]